MSTRKLDLAAEGFSISMAKEHCVWLHLSEEANLGGADMAVHGNIDAIALTDLPRAKFPLVINQKTAKARGIVVPIGALFCQPNSTYGPSMLFDMEGRPTEREQTISDLADRAARAGVRAPLLAAARCNLQPYEINRITKTTHFLIKTLPKVASEMALSVLAYILGPAISADFKIS